MNNTLAARTSPLKLVDEPKKKRKVGVNQKVTARIQRRKSIKEADVIIASNLRSLSKLNADIVNKIGEASKVVKPTDEQKISIRALKKIEKERLDREAFLAVRRWHMTSDFSYMENCKKRIPALSRDSVNASIVNSMSNTPSVNYTNFKISVAKHKEVYEREYQRWKKAVEDPKSNIELRDYSSYEAITKLKVYSQIITAFDVILNLTSYYKVGNSEAFRANSCEYDYCTTWLDFGDHHASSADECLLMRKKQVAYYQRLHKRKETDIYIKEGFGKLDFSDVTKFQNLKKDV